MEGSKDPISDSELELYTIPSSSKWFAWDEIHETEKTAFKEYFDGTSITRTPKIYKEYRDFIINKYREEPSRRLTFTEVRKSLVGDVTFLNKVFLFLECWGLINYGAPSAGNDGEAEKEHEKERCKLKVEEGAPNGIRVVATPNSLKPISLPRDTKIAAGGGDESGAGVKIAPLASYSDVYGDLIRRKEVNCGNCGDKCGSGHYRSTKDNFIICTKCFKNGNYGEKRSMEDFKLNESSEISANHSAVWTEGETLLLLESVLKHGDDWELVAQSVRTKTKLECISKLIELPFGELMLASVRRNDNSNSVTGIVNNRNQVQVSSSDHQETSMTQDQSSEPKNEVEQNGDAVNENPSKRRRVSTLSDSSSSLMKQVGLLSTVVDPHVTAAAASAAITALCDENSLPRDIFDVEEDNASARALEAEGLEMVEGSTQSEVKDDIPLTLRIRAAIGTALGATAARAKLLADQEDREIEHLVATIIEAQVEKLQQKVKHFDELELLMEKEHAEMEELKDSILTERIDVLRKTFKSGVARWKHYPSLKS
ncbi:putative transcription factor MYB/SANT family [Medicago truncatula]|uniref:Putative transcription factor MYB/SANT family n=1 Tax=Medicago truncatula TaxID=3880 RepID=G7J3D7_MEDTR|nr:SWI/SNF complex subunit SWI3A [Medicago truncatula]XP_024635358.1 SWI/SNF complex subunit SWI3A [Medicago truncatula]AES73038.1 SWI/SNF complex protein [Medicago truncatula]RHN70107.1 putative transcription factor MYB/SANT family [Medicago truncatula]